MTFVDLNTLEKRRLAGEAPQGGPAPDFSSIDKSFGGSPKQQLDQLLNLLWDHPGDDTLVHAVQSKIGGSHARATLLMAAGYIRALHRGCDGSEQERQAYDRVVAGVSPQNTKS
jgi:hypothetical protein